MKRSKFNYQPTSWAMLAFALLLVLVALAPTPLAQAQKGKGKNVIVRNDGAVFEIKKSDRTVMPSRAATPEVSKLLNQRVEAKNLAPVLAQSPESVIGPDGRQSVTNTTTYPNSAIAQLEVTYPTSAGICTGWFISPTRLATAAHCIYLASEGGFANAITVAPGRNGLTDPFGTFAVTNAYVTQKWVDTENPKYDYGLLILGSNVGDTVGWFGYAWNSADSFYLNRKITVRGYPGDKPFGTMWTMNGKIQEVKPTRLYYSIDTFGGQSGSPAYGKQSGGCDPCGFGIHTYGVGGNTDKNSATRITKKVFNFLSAPIQ